ncbi:hypothetical protein U9M48_026267 [Paspalum notatum var. saurae]|uniref:Uncharacterized protein n=1 Tax=Paspalum notatum var. saurae TaxID=547442 RepID=A0AAQ3WYU1_PASNO
MDEVGGGGARSQVVNPDCPNAANPFHRCAEYCPVPAPRAAAKPLPSPPRQRMTPAAQNGTKHGDGAGPGRPVAAGLGEAGGEARLQAVHPDPDYPNADGEPSPPRQGPEPGYAYAAQNGTAHHHRYEEPEPEITVVDDSDEAAGETVGDAAGEGGARRRSARPPAARHEEAGGGGQWQAVNPDCPNAANPFHRCAEYCPVPVPRGAAKLPRPPRGHEGSTLSDPGELQPRPRRRDKGGGSGGLPLYVFLREGSDGGGKKVDPRCPNAPNPFHVCTEHCLAKMAEAGRSSEGMKSPISLFSRHSRRSSSSSEEGSVKSAGSRKVDPKCPNASNPFHECGENCTARMQQVEQPKAAKLKSPRRKGGKDVPVIQNWKVDPRCPNASNPFHMCAQYCFDHLNETAQTSTTKSDKKKGKSVPKEGPARQEGLFG